MKAALDIYLPNKIKEDIRLIFYCYYPIRMWQEHIAALYEMHCKLFWGAEFFFMEKSTEKIKKSFNRQQEKTMFLKNKL